MQSTMNTSFQKNYVVWKVRIGVLMPIYHQVSEELCSMERYSGEFTLGR